MQARLAQDNELNTLSMTDAFFRSAMRLIDLPEGRMGACQIGGREILICHTRDGIFALDNLCTHA